MILEHPIVLADMESVDAEYHRSLVWITENDPEPLALTFQVRPAFAHTARLHWRTCLHLAHASAPHLSAAALSSARNFTPLFSPYPVRLTSTSMASTRRWS